MHNNPLAKIRSVATTMLRILLALSFVLSWTASQAQQWISPRYTYDSLLNIPYGASVDFNGRTVTHTLDIYLPQCDDPQHISRRPLLLLIHGGAFLAGDKNDVNIKTLCTRFAQRGYVTATISYRLGFVADDVAWTCNYPGYGCVFAADTAEWYRAYYRAVQDGKGALRYLINRNSTYRIDTNNVFIAGESAGAFIAMGVGLMDTTSERPPLTGPLPDVPVPNTSTDSCSYNAGQVFTGTTIARPDLGSIVGTIEPTNIRYTVKGIGNFYGAMFNDLLRWNTSPVKPALYSFHQPCDIVVPIDVDRIYWGLSWCMTNGYGCSAIAQTPRVYGSRAINQWNALNSYGYTIQDQFTATTFPYNYLFGPGSCLDQVNNPCHAFDNFNVRDQQLAQFFSTYISISPLCDTVFTSSMSELDAGYRVMVFPNPVTDQLTVQWPENKVGLLQITDVMGRSMFSSQTTGTTREYIDVRSWSAGIYWVTFRESDGRTASVRFVKT